jgi:hypothetical protein
MPDIGGGLVDLIKGIGGGFLHSAEDTGRGLEHIIKSSGLGSYKEGELDKLLGGAPEHIVQALKDINNLVSVSTGGAAAPTTQPPKTQLPAGAATQTGTVSPAQQLSNYVAQTLQPYASTAQADVTKMGDFSPSNDPFMAMMPQGMQNAYKSTESGITGPLSQGITAATTMGTESPQVALINQLLQLISGEAKYATAPSAIFSPTANTYGANPGVTALLHGADLAAGGVTGPGSIFGSGTAASTTTSAPTGPSTVPKPAGT